MGSVGIHSSTLKLTAGFETVNPNFKCDVVHEISHLRGSSFPLLSSKTR